MAVTNEPLELDKKKFGMERNNNHIHKLVLKFCLQIKSYRHGDGAKR
jgi:hypothetical protein